MGLVIIESPYAGEIEENMRYARLCLRDSLDRGEAPFASHLLYTQDGVLDDGDPKERRRGIEAGFAWKGKACLSAFYLDRTISKGMVEGLERSRRLGAEAVARFVGYPQHLVIRGHERAGLTLAYAKELLTRAVRTPTAQAPASPWWWGCHWS